MLLQKDMSAYGPFFSPFGCLSPSEGFCVLVASIKLPKTNKAARTVWGVEREILHI